MRRFYPGFIALLLMTGSAPALAEHRCPDTTDYSQRPKAQAMIRELVAEGQDESRLRQLLQNAQCQPGILESIARPAEKTHTWASYQRIFLQEERVRQGVAFASRHRETLDRAVQAYGVPRAILLAIIGVETRYGQHMGDHRVIDALATLGFDYPPRAAFFRKQLKALFQLEQAAHIDAEQITGSYAGAMGYGQFIPTSYQAYAVDFDNDGVTDLVNSPEDAIGSVANYFSEHNWQPGLPVAARARIKGTGYQTLAEKGKKPSFTLAQAQQKKVTALSCQAELTSEYCFDLPDDTPVALLDLEGTHGMEFWLATGNFYTITRYNHSRLYAMAVTQLAHRLSRALEQEQQ